MFHFTVNLVVSGSWIWDARSNILHCLINNDLSSKKRWKQNLSYINALEKVIFLSKNIKF